MSLIHRWAFPPEWMPEPQAEGPLVPANLTRYGNGLGEVGGGVLALQDRLPGNTGRRR